MKTSFVLFLIALAMGLAGAVSAMSGERHETLGVILSIGVMSLALAGISID